MHSDLIILSPKAVDKFYDVYSEERFLQVREGKMFEKEEWLAMKMP
jgi:hypothetical protein